MNIERNGYKSYIITKDFFKMRYIDYTRKEAINMFRKDFKNEQSKVFINSTKDMNTKEETVEYWRNPTAYEIKFGEGAVHYLTVNKSDVRKKNGQLKKWFKFDGLRYNY